jgi:hypothetical protein
MILAGACGIGALILLLRHDFDKAFIVVVIGALAWFLSYRVELRQLVAADEKEESNENVESNEDD